MGLGHSCLRLRSSEPQTLTSAVPGATLDSNRGSGLRIHTRKLLYDVRARDERGAWIPACAGMTAVCPSSLLENLSAVTGTDPPASL